MGGEERRYGPRVPLSIGLRVSWTDAQGKTTEERTETEVLNGAGARFRLKNIVGLGLEMELINLENRETARARVVWASEPLPQDGQRVGVEFLTPKAAFWGPYYNP